MSTNDCTGVLLAGGKSSRFGANKALTKLAGKAMIEHPAKILAELFENYLLITNTPAEYAFLGWPMVGDIYPDAGPLAGIHTALKAVTSPLIFVAGCDMPFLDKTLISYLCSLVEGYDVVVPRTAKGLEPLHAIYRQSIVEIIDKNLARGNRKIHQVFSELKIREVSEAEMLAATGDLISFRNINTMADLPE
ncbi:MAG: molybdenum cofactor guanylyltransferase [Desulfobulbaceae bacterium]|nr:molybdenum cofactor guanylyltransferase [Desulfobulbaceae bacterium]